MIAASLLDIPASISTATMSTTATLAATGSAALDAFLASPLEPLQHPFMIEVLIASGLISAVAAILSCYLVLKGWSLIGDAISHAVLPGIIISYIIGLPMVIGAFIAGMTCAVTTGWIKSHSRIKEDTVLGIVFTGLFALGLVLMTKVETNIHFMHILRGNLLGITRPDLIQLIIICTVTLLIALAKSRDLMLLCFDPAQARASGLRTTFLYYLLLAMVSLTVVAALQAVGFILTVAMFITPGATAYMLCDRFGRMMLVAVASALTSAIAGTYISFFLDGSTAALICLFQGFIFTLAIIFAPQHGLISHFLTRRAAINALHTSNP